MFESHSRFIPGLWKKNLISFSHGIKDFAFTKKKKLYLKLNLRAKSEITECAVIRDRNKYN